MSAEPEKDLSLELQLLPDWAQQDPQVNKYADYRGGGDSDRPPRRGRREGGHDGRRGRPRDNRQGQRGSGAGTQRKGPPRDRRQDKSGRDEKPRRGKRPRRDSREAREEEPLPELKVSIVPDEKGVESIAREIKLTGKAYPIFQIAHLILERPERHVMEVNVQRGEGGQPLQPLFRCRLDESMWLSGTEVAHHVMRKHFDQFYEVKRTETEGPKGSYNCVAQCGISGRLLGPPNYHGYQNNLAKLHAERFSKMSFEEYKSRVVTVHDEATVEKWIEEAKWKTEFVTRKVEPPLIFNSRDEARAHFEQVHLGEVCEEVKQSTITGTAARELRSPRQLVRILKWAWQQQRRFPLQIATHLSKQFSAHGLQFFKRDKTVTHVAVARPKFLNVETTAVSDGIRQIVETIDSTENCTRRMILEALVPECDSGDGGQSAQPEGQEATLSPESSAPESSVKEESLQAPEPPSGQTQVVADLHWLIHQGHVIEFANGIIETAKKPRPKESAKGNPSAPASEEEQPEESKTQEVSTVESTQETSVNIDPDEAPAKTESPEAD